MDPALPLFALSHPDGRISSDDANNVEIIHSAGFIPGDPKILGHFDFYPNGGLTQPGCPNNLRGAPCSHSKAYEYFAESLKNSNPKFYSLKCASYDDFNSHKCENYETVMGGIDYVPEYQGTYYLNTSSKAPYALGKPKYL